MRILQASQKQALPVSALQRRHRKCRADATKGAALTWRRLKPELALHDHSGVFASGISPTEKNDISKSRGLHWDKLLENPHTALFAKLLELMHASERLHPRRRDELVFRAA
jgi:hypothetical protein